MADENHDSRGHDIVVVGASAGGVEALMNFVSGLPPKLPAAIFIVLHTTGHSPNLLPQILARRAQMIVKQAEDHEEIRRGRIYVAVPDHHLLIHPGFLRVVYGPKENFHRPAIDPLFRSAARSYGPRCIGVILTGTRDDGTAGMTAIKSRLGIAIVQEPKDAFYPDMPLSVLLNVDVDYRVPLEEIAPLVARVVSEPSRREEEVPVSEDLNTEAQLVEQEMGSQEMIASVQKLGKVSTLTCPECHGALWEIRDPNMLRFRCHVGHGYSAESLASGQDEALEQALWSALRALEEKMLLSQRTLQKAREKNLSKATTLLEQRAAHAEHQANIIRQVLVKGQDRVNGGDQEPDTT